VAAQVELVGLLSVGDPVEGLLDEDVRIRGRRMLE
jgi:hypothetical protein